MKLAHFATLLTCVLLVYGVEQIAGQSVFPVRLDEPEVEAPATGLSSGSFHVQGETDFRARGAVTATPGAEEDLLRIEASQDDTTAWLEVTIAGAESDATSGAHVLTLLLWYIYDSGANTWTNLGVAASLNIGGGMSIDTTTSGNQLTLSFTTPNDLDQVTYLIEVVTNRPATFTQLI